MRAARACLVLALLVAAGCGRSELLRTRYKAERLYWSASREEIATRLGSERPDSLQLLALREVYRAVGAGIDPSRLPLRNASDRALRRDVKHVLGSADLDAGRIGLEANRVDLALEDTDRARALGDEDTLLVKAADFFKVEVFRQSRRDEDAVAAMQQILDRYEPGIPQDRIGEDPILALPEAIVALREQMGDRDGAARATQAAEGYYRAQLDRAWPPEGEAGILARLVRLELEERDWDAALGDLKRLQGLAQASPSLSQHEPEIHYFEATIRAKKMETFDPLEAVSLLDAVVEQYPQSPFAARAAYDAGVMLEEHGRKKEALDRYRIISERFADNADVAPDAAYRRALLQDALGDWGGSKSQLEVIPIRYPDSEAALDAPMAVVRHYQAAGEPDAAQTSMRKAASTYENLIANRPKSPYRAAYRWSLAQARFQLGQWGAGLSTIDAMVQADPGHPLTAQGLLQAAKVAEAHDQADRAIGYLTRYLALHPDPARIGDVRKDLERLQ